jgi:hypothetical protein
MTPDERNDLTRRINRLYFEEYATTGWCKAVTFSELRKHASEQDKRFLDEYLKVPNPDDSLRRGMIRIFFDEWLIYHLPESMGCGDAGTFQRVDRASALEVIDRVIGSSLRRGERVERRLPWLQPDGEYDQGEESYERIRGWFVDLLFDPSEVTYFLDPIVAEKPTDGATSVIGMDKRVIGMLWEER